MSSCFRVARIIIDLVVAENAHKNSLVSIESLKSKLFQEEWRRSCGIGSIDSIERDSSFPNTSCLNSFDLTDTSYQKINNSLRENKNCARSAKARKARAPTRANTVVASHQNRILVPEANQLIIIIIIFFFFFLSFNHVDCLRLFRCCCCCCCSSSSSPPRRAFCTGETGIPS